MIRDLTNYDLIFIFFRLLYFQNLQILADTSHVIWFGNQESTPTWALLSRRPCWIFPVPGGIKEDQHGTVGVHYLLLPTAARVNVSTRTGQCCG